MDYLLVILTMAEGVTVRWFGDSGGRYGSLECSLNLTGMDMMASHLPSLFYFWFTHLLWMPFLMEQNIALYPEDIRLFCRSGIVLQVEDFPNLVKQFFWGVAVDFMLCLHEREA